MKAIIKAELYRFFSTKSCWLGLSLSFILPIAIYLYLNMNHQLVTTIDKSAIILISLNFASVGIIFFSAYFFGEEYQQNLLRTTLLSVPNRVKVLLAKLLSLNALVLVTFFLIAITLISLNLFFRNGTTPIMPEILWKRLLLILISEELLVLITCGICILFKSTYLAVALLVCLQIGGSQMLLAFNDYAKYLPDLAVINLYTWTPQQAFLNIGAGMVVQGIWATLVFMLSLLLFSKRDVR